MPNALKGLAGFVATLVLSGLMILNRPRRASMMLTVVSFGLGSSAIVIG